MAVILGTLVTAAVLSVLIQKIVYGLHCLLQHSPTLFGRDMSVLP
jgi:hypothetical protein